MDGLRIDAISSRCVVCCRELGVRHRVLGSYRGSDLVYTRHELEVGLFTGDVRPVWSHVDCADPTLLRWNMRPDVTYCIRCREKLKTADIIQPVFGVEDGQAVNPADPTDRGLLLGERMYFIHVDCRNPSLSQGSGILVTA